MGYLEQQYLGGDLADDLDLSGASDDQGPTVPGTLLAQATGSQEVIVLPGGITIPKQTFWLLTGLAIAALLVLYARKKDAAA